MKGLMVFVYKDASGYDCTNGGVTANVKDAVLIGDSVPKIFDVNEDRPALFLSEFRNRIIAVPSPTRPDSLVSLDGKRYMFGGNFIYTSDSRFPSEYPIPVYDRTEDPNDYNSLD